MGKLTFCSAGQLATDRTLRYVDNAFSQNTLKAYRSDLKHFLAWGGSIPSSANQIASYLTEHANTLTVSTLRRRLVSISKAHAISNIPNPIENELVKLTLRGICRVHGRPQREAAPILRDDLIAMLAHIPAGVKGERDRALLLLGFSGALRRSELVAIKSSHIQFVSQGFLLLLPRGKTDQYGEGRKIGIPSGCGRICPVEAVKVWMRHLGADDGFIFRPVSKGSVISNKVLSDRAVSNIVKYYAEKIGLDPQFYSGHSLRAGLATSAAQRGISSWKIRAQTGHRSDKMLAKYIRDGDIFTDNAAALF